MEWPPPKFFGPQLNQVTAEHKLVAKLSDGQLQLDLAEGQKIWEEAIPCLMKSKA